MKKTPGIRIRFVAAAPTADAGGEPTDLYHCEAWVEENKDGSIHFYDIILDGEQMAPREVPARLVPQVAEELDLETARIERNLYTFIQEG